MANKEIFSNDAEVAILSMVLKNPDNAYDLEGLKDFMFSSSPHQALFYHIQECIENQIPTDVGLMVARLEAANELEKVGGKKYIDFLVKQDYNIDTLLEWKKLVIDSYKARSMISIGSKLNVERLNADNIDEVISSTRMSLDRLLEVRGGTQTVHIGDTVRNVYEEIISRHENPGIRGASWGIPDLDTATGGKCGGELWVIGGRPGQGKSALIINSILTDARAGVASLIFQREMRVQEMVERLVSLITGIPITNIRLGILNQTQVTAIYDALAELKKLPIYIDTSYRSADMYYIESTVTKYKNLYDIKVVYLDYIQILIERDDNQTHEIGKISRMFKTLANEKDICAVLLSQLNRGVEARENKRPILSDLRQSGNLEEDADLVVGLYRDEYYNKETRFKGLMEFIILKYRNGPVGSISLKFHDATNKISGT